MESRLAELELKLYASAVPTDVADVSSRLDAAWKDLERALKRLDAVDAGRRAR